MRVLDVADNYYGGYVPINGRPLFIEVCGPLYGDPFVAMHGLGGSTNTFPIANEIAALGFRVVRWDCEGSGKSPMGRGKAFTIEGLLQDLEAIIQFAIGDRELGKVHVYGHSGGAMIGQYYAARRPEVVSSLMLVAPALPRFDRPAVQSRTLGFVQRARKVGIYALADSAYERNLGPNATAAMKLVYRTTHSEGTTEGYAQILELLAFLPTPDWPSITCKTLVIGATDDLAFGREAEEYPGKLTGTVAQLVVLECGHIPALEAPDDVLSVLTDFLEEFRAL